MPEEISRISASPDPKRPQSSPRKPKKTPQHHLRARKPLLSSTRPSIPSGPLQNRPLPSNASRALIRRQHRLNKNLTVALRNEDVDGAVQIRKEIASLGGLKRYQDASLSGQRRDRGGDTGAVLVQWLCEAELGLESTQSKTQTPKHVNTTEKNVPAGKGDGLRMLDVGALSIDGACARSGRFRKDGTIDGGIDRIDLNSRNPRIRQVDFMEMGPPATEAEEKEAGYPSSDNSQGEGYDIVALSLVLNFVSDPAARGEMLKHVALFLRRGRRPGESSPQESRFDGLLPGLFLVLPAPCVENSRYLDETRMVGIMRALGYTLVRRKASAKLLCYLWRYDSRDFASDSVDAFKKHEVRKGKDRNNFAIVLQ